MYTCLDLGASPKENHPQVWSCWGIFLPSETAIHFYFRLLLKSVAPGLMGVGIQRSKTSYLNSQELPLSSYRRVWHLCKFGVLLRVTGDRKHGMGRGRAQGMWKWKSGSVRSLTSVYLAPCWVLRCSVEQDLHGASLLEL